ncbi:winged helix-turn-helix domain-containing protein [Robertmurraya sp. GLU-23]
MNKTILILDNYYEEYFILIKRLEQLRFRVHTKDFQEGLTNLVQIKPDLIFSNFSLFLQYEKDFKQLRLKLNLPIIFVNSLSSEEAILHAFEKGATDYITVPFSPREVEARVKAIFRRIEMTKSKLTHEIIIGGLVIKPEQFEIVLKTNKVYLSRREFQVLMLLIERRVISREEMIRYIWGFDYYGGFRIVDINISNLRKKIEKDPKKPQYITTIKGYGYRFNDCVM